MEEFHRIPVIIRNDMSDEDIDSDEIRGIEGGMGLVGKALKIVEKFGDSESGGESSERDNREDCCDPFDLVEKLKREASVHYSNKRYDLALKLYIKAKTVLQIETNLVNDDVKESNVERQVNHLLSMYILESNCVACHVEKREYDKAVIESKRVLDDMSLKRAGFNKIDMRLPTLWTNIENKLMYRYSLSVYNIYKKENDKENCNSKLEALAMISKVYDYYDKELMVEPPRDVLELYFELKRIEQSEGNKHEEVNISRCNGKSSQEGDDYLRFCIEAYLNSGGGGGNSKSWFPEPPTEIVNKIPCNTSVDFVKIWQNISHNEHWVDYFIIYRRDKGDGCEATTEDSRGCVFEEIDKLFEKTELESTILEKILERISVILDKTIEISLENGFCGDSNESKLRRTSDRKVAFLENIIDLLNKLARTHKFDFSLMMMSVGSSSFKISEKLLVILNTLDNGVEKTNYLNKINNLGFLKTEIS